MDERGVRTLTSQLAEDFSWLEDHCRRQANLADRAGQLRLAAAVVRNVLGPFLEGQTAEPLHLAVVGGAGAGKSTVSNMLSGQVLAETNPQAGFTRHPIAYVHGNGQLAWPSQLGFLGPLQKLTKPSPANVDADVYQVRRVSVEPGAATLLEKCVIWDCPDMTTWAAVGYASRLIEVAGLADVIVYVASDERYNDEVPTQFLQLLLQAGKAVVVCLVKMKPADAPAFVAHFQKEVLSRMPGHVTATLTIPQLTHPQLADPVRQAPQYRIPLVNQVSVMTESSAGARRRNVQAAVHFLKHGQDQLLGVARDDLAALSAWRQLVQQGQVEFDTRYRREYLTTQKFHRFDEALIRLLELLELPGMGKIVSQALWVVRTPFRLVKGLFTKALQRPEGAHLPEKPVLEGAFSGWQDLLRKEAARRAAGHPLWAHINRGFAGGLGEQARDQFDHGFRAFQLSQADEIERTARAIYEELEKNPVALNTLRGTKFSLEVAAIAGTVAAGGLSLADLVLAPLAAFVIQQLVEVMGKQYVDGQREHARARQQALVAQYISGPLADWLSKWPSTGGSEYERLQLALRRIPENIKHLELEVTHKMEKVNP